MGLRSTAQRRAVLQGVDLRRQHLSADAQAFAHFDERGVIGLEAQGHGATHQLVLVDHQHIGDTGIAADRLSRIA